jgi:septum formation topological specificity factor MinE
MKANERTQVREEMKQEVLEVLRKIKNIPMDQLGLNKDEALAWRCGLALAVGKVGQL